MWWGRSGRTVRRRRVVRRRRSSSRRREASPPVPLSACAERGDDQPRRGGWKVTYRAFLLSSSRVLLGYHLRNRTGDHLNQEQRSFHVYDDRRCSESESPLVRMNRSVQFTVRGKTFLSTRSAKGSRPNAPRINELSIDSMRWALPS